MFASGITPTELTWSATYQTADGRDRLPSIPGHDVSGVVEALGTDVRDLSIGEAVYGLTEFPRDGSAAEYVVVRASGLAPKPVTLDHVNAAAVPLSVLTAWQALFVHGDLLPGQRVLIHGAAGGVGSFAVQLARWRGAEVSGTASARHNQFLRRLGVETLINYQQWPDRQLELLGFLVYPAIVPSQLTDCTWTWRAAGCLTSGLRIPISLFGNSTCSTVLVRPVGG